MMLIMLTESFISEKRGARFEKLETAHQRSSCQGEA